MKVESLCACMPFQQATPCHTASRRRLSQVLGQAMDTMQQQAHRLEQKALRTLDQRINNFHKLAEGLAAGKLAAQPGADSLAVDSRPHSRRHSFSGAVASQHLALSEDESMAGAGLSAHRLKFLGLNYSMVKDAVRELYEQAQAANYGRKPDGSEAESLDDEQLQETMRKVRFFLIVWQASILCEHKPNVRLREFLLPAV